MGKFKISFFLFFLILLSSCKAKYLSIPPIPKDKMDISSELQYIENTDQTDRKKGFIHTVFNNKKGKLINQRDSVRARRVFELYTKGQIQADDDKFTAGLILMHSPIDCHGKIAYEVFSDLEENGSTISARMNGKNWKELVVSKEIYSPDNSIKE